MTKLTLARISSVTPAIAIALSVLSLVQCQSRAVAADDARQADLPRFDGKPVGFWVERLKDHEAKTRLEAVGALDALAPPRTSSNPEAQLGTSKEPDKAGPDSPAAAVAALIKATEDEDTDVRKYAITALGAYGSNAKGAIPLVLRAIEDRDENFRLRAVDAIGDIGVDDPAVLVTLRRLLFDNTALGHGNARKAALAAVAKIGPNAVKAMLPTLDKAMRNPHFSNTLDPNWPVEVADVLVLAGDSGVPIFVDYLTSNSTGLDGSYKEYADKRVLPALTVIGQAGPRALVGLLKREDESGIADRAEAEIIWMGKGALPYLIEAMKKEDNRRAHLVIGQMHEDALAALPDLMNLLRSDKPYIRERSAITLGMIGPPAHDAVPALTKAADDKDPSVRSAADQALKAIQSPQE